MSNTKEKIISKATKLFNDKGFASVNMLDLAKAMNISRGNLTYHFKDKDILLAAIADAMWSKIETERAKSRQFPSFENLHNEVQLYYHFQKEYAFIFLDNHVLTHSIIKKKFRKMTKQSIEDNKATIAFSIKLGNIKNEEVPGTYNNIAFITWMIIFFWYAQQVITGDKSKEDGEKMIWSIIVPHFTKKGIKSFKRFFGKSYYENLGEPFENNNMITF